MGRAARVYLFGGSVSGHFGIALQHCCVAATSRRCLKPIRHVKSDWTLAAALNETLHHERDADDYDQCGSPAESVGAIAFFWRAGRPIRHDFSKAESCDQSAEMRVIVNSGKKKSPNRDVNEPSNNLAAEHLHTSAFSTGGDC